MNIVKKAKTDGLYLGEFNYSVTVVFNGAYYLRRRGKKIPTNNDILSIYKLRAKMFGDSDKTDHFAKILKLAEYFRKLTKKFSYRVYINRIHLYTDDLTIVDELQQQFQCTIEKISEANIVKIKNAINLVRPKNKFRCFLQQTVFTKDQRQEILTYLKQNNTTLKASRSLSRFLDSSDDRAHYASGNFYIDYDDEKHLLMLRLKFPDLFRKTLPIVKVPS